MPLSLKEPQTVELARAHAEKIGVPVNVAVVDGGGHLLAFARMFGHCWQRLVSRPTR
jgi:uncharacterized protein GlcG (DUF336 family)